MWSPMAATQSEGVGHDTLPPEESRVTVQPRAPPAGRFEVRRSPASSSAAQNEAEGQEMPLLPKTYAPVEVFGAPK
jgi:hypothetical protein